MSQLDNWNRAKYELEYRTKQEYNAVQYKLSPNERSNIEGKLKQEVELRAYLIYRATNDNTLENWNTAAREFEESHWGLSEAFKTFKDSLIIVSGNRIPEEKAYILSRIEFISKRAFFLWEDKRRQDIDWYEAESSQDIREKIEHNTRIIKQKFKHLSDQEACFCARDNLHKDIQEKAHDRHEWISKRAYELWKNDQGTSPEDNWFKAVREWK